MDWKPRKVVMGFLIPRTGANPDSVLFSDLRNETKYSGDRIILVMRFLRDDNTGAYGAIYTGGVNDDITQNAIPIATNTILIIFMSPSFWVFFGEYPGLVPELHTHILHPNR